MVNKVTNSEVEYRVRKNDGIITDAPLITGYEVTRFGVPMIGQYVNTGRGRRVTISPTVPGAQYRITAWALGNVRRSATPAVADATTGEAGERGSMECTIIIIFNDMKCIYVYENRAFLNAQCNFAFIIAHYVQYI